MKKRIFAAILAASVIFATAACSESADSGQSEADGASGNGASVMTTDVKSTAEATSATTVATTTAPQEATAEAEQAKPQTVEAVVEEIVPLEIEPWVSSNDAVFKMNGRTTIISELSAISTLLRTINIWYDYHSVSTTFKSGSTFDNPLPTSSFIKNWGCYPEVIADSLNNDKLISERINVMPLSDFPATELYNLIDSGIPVMVWIIEELLPAELIAEAEGIKMYDPHETVILVGYSENQVMAWSPFQENYVTYNKADFENSYETLGSFALTVIQK